MFRRQKILLALLEQFGGELSRTRMQKLLFLYCEQNADPIYGFVPYKYGCFSFQAAADKRKLTEKGLLDDSDNWRLTKRSGHAEKLNYQERQALWSLNNRFRNSSQKDLIRHVYISYPYFATRSEIAGKYLSQDECDIVTGCVLKVKGASICSIGYEGLLLEEYLNKLIRYNVRLVCDVRKNPLSRKFGFSKKSLSSALDHMGIEYRHFPELGIVADKRKQLNNQADYDDLFDEYEKTTLKDAYASVIEIANIFKDKERIALLCFEKLPEQCHRTRILNAMSAYLHKANYTIYTE